MKGSISKTLARNNAFNAASFFIQLLVTMIITPYTLHKLGTTLFGVWVIIGVITSYAYLGDLGLGRALIKFIAEFDGKRDYSSMNKVLNTAMVIYFFSASIIGVILLILRDFFVIRLFNIPSELYHIAIFVYIFTVIIFFMNIIFGAIDSFLQGLQRMDVTNSISSISKIINAIGVFIVLEAGYGLKGLILKNGIISVITISTNFYFARKIYPFLRINPFLFCKEKMRQIFSFSINVELSYIARLLLDPLNKILLTNFLSLNYVALYEVAMRIINLSIGFIRSTIASIFPAGTKLYVSEGKDRMRYFYLKSLRYLALIAIPFFSLLFLLATPFIQTWLGQGYKVSSFTLQIFALPWLVSALSVPAFLLVQSIGFPRLSLYSVIIYGITNLVLSYLFITLFGYYGLIIGNSIAVTVSGLVIIIFFQKKINLPFIETFRVIFNRALVANFIAVITTLFLIFYIKPDTFSTLFIVAIAFILVYSMAILKSKWVTVEDMQVLERILPSRVNIYIKNSFFLKRLLNVEAK